MIISKVILSGRLVEIRGGARVREGSFPKSTWTSVEAQVALGAKKETSRVHAWRP